MKKIIYLTTAMDNDDYAEYIKHWSIKPNPSNQNFHNKMIRSLALTYHVDVISVRPYSRKLCDLKKLPKQEKNTNNITWHYLAINKNPFIKLVSTKNKAINIINKLINKSNNDEYYLFTDTINLGIVHILKHITKTFKNIIYIGVVSDSPSNISNTSRSYTKYILNNTSSLDGYIALTRELNDLYNQNKKPYLINEGIVEIRDDIKQDYLPIKYFFFAGALLPRYGIYELIEAFKKILKKYPHYYLLICGHHGDENYLNEQIKDFDNIRYLKTIPYLDVLYYENGAIANINPRPFSEDLDRFSIPSKTLEYACSDALTISVKNSKLIKYFPQEILWTKSAKVDDLYEAIEKVITNEESLNKELAKKAKQIALDNFSKESVNKKISNFLEILTNEHKDKCHN